MQELELKVQGGLCVKGGGVIVGFYGIVKTIIISMNLLSLDELSSSD